MENQRKATPRQLAYIQQLRKKQGKDSLEIDEKLTSQEASTIIKELMGNCQPNEEIRPAKINEARLGMAFIKKGGKEAYYLTHPSEFLAI
jgi:hypothetical protein